GGLRRIAAAPALPDKSPAYFHGRHDLRQERGLAQASEADEASVVQPLDRKQAVAVFTPVPFESTDRRARLFSCSRRSRANVAHDGRVAAHGGVWVEILVSPTSQQQTLRRDRGIAHRSMRQLACDNRAVRRAPSAEPTAGRYPAPILPGPTGSR